MGTCLGLAVLTYLQSLTGSLGSWLAQSGLSWNVSPLLRMVSAPLTPWEAIPDLFLGQ